ncbi:YbaN family protein [Lutimaribacter marinistellae]|uniref:YbaN family protein n=1 Tax=Lutimaribacter marinistellae TaxID=1820329 RepID=A0ABV7TF01_9RHOB
MKRYFFALFGLICVVFGLVGVALPLVPTVPFMLLAAFFFARSSSRLHHWLITHRTFGPMIEDWHHHRAIRPSAKRAATISIIVVFAISVVLSVPQHVLIIQVVTLGGVLIFIWTRPNG